MIKMSNKTVVKYNSYVHVPATSFRSWLPQFSRGGNGEESHSLGNFFLPDGTFLFRIHLASDGTAVSIGEVFRVGHCSNDPAVKQTNYKT